MLKIEDAREQAREAIKRIKAGRRQSSRQRPSRIRSGALPKIGSSVTSRKQIAEQREIERCLNKYVFPHWADRDFIAHQAQRRCRSCSTISRIITAPAKPIWCWHRAHHFPTGLPPGTTILFVAVRARDATAQCRSRAPVFSTTTNCGWSGGRPRPMVALAQSSACCC